MSTNPQNPYIGPRTFRREEGHLFFGRDKEAADLEALVVSEKLVLFYAQSGAGKSSLINARLIPSLEDKLFEVLPVTRLGGDTPAGVEAGNIYIFNLIRSLQRRESDPGLFRALTLPHFLKKLNEDQDGYFYDPDLTQSLRSTFDPTPWPRLLIIDQFEEIFSTNVESWQQREEFFRQLAQAMQDDPFLWILLVMREDFIASLDPYVHLLPGGLRVRYYMERLSHEAAVKAIRSPVEKQRPYAEGVAEKLAEDLSRVKVQKPDGTTGTEAGQYIEPVQLQVVCYSLWENLPPGGTEITEKDLQDVGDVNQSLARYYDQRVSEVVSAKHVRERQIRDWFDQKLITGGGIRNMVIQERETPPGGLDDDVIRALQSDLVRAEKRGGATWYELTHDRLVEPILASNKKWFEENLSPLQRQAQVWEDRGRNDNWLLRDQAYMEMLPWVDEHRDELTGPELEFLEASREQRDKQLQDIRRRRRYTTSITAIAAIAVLLLIFTIVFAVQARQQAKISRVGELAAHSVSLRDKNFLISLLLGVEAIDELDEGITSVRAQSVLLENSQANPQLEQFLSGNTGPVVSAVYSPDGKTLASGTYDKDILLWDVKTRQPIGTLSGHTDIIRSIAFNRDGSIMASGSEDKTILLWDMKTRQPIHTLSGHSDVLTSVAFSPDGKTLASGSDDKTIILWDVKTGLPIQTLSGHSGFVRSVAFSLDGKTLASGSYDGTIILWDVKTGQPVGKLQIAYTDPVFQEDVRSPVLSVAFSPDGKTLAAGDYDKNVTLWDVQTGQPIHTLTLSKHSDIVRTLAFSPDGKTLASGSADRTIILWDVATGQFRDQLKGHSDLINSLSYSPDGSTLASGGGDTTIILWDMNPRQPLRRTLSGFAHNGPVLSIAFSPDGKRLASGSVDATIMLWDVGKGESIGKPFNSHTAPITSVAFSPDGKILASGSVDQTIILWDVEKGLPIGQPLRGHSESVTSIAFSPDGRTLASGSEDTSIMLWDVKTSQSIGEPLSGHTAAINSVAFSPDGRTLASGSVDQTIILWDARNHQAIVTLSGHSLAVSHLVFSPDGRTLASGSVDQTIILWDVKTYQPIGSLSGNPAPIESLTFSPDSKTLASSSFDITLWDSHEQLWAIASCQRAGRNFTRNEWEIYFPNETYRTTCQEFPLELAATQR